MKHLARHEIVDILRTEARGRFSIIHAALLKAQKEAGYGMSLDIDRVLQIIKTENIDSPTTTPIDGCLPPAQE